MAVNAALQPCDGRKTSTFRGKIGTSSPVLGCVDPLPLPPNGKTAEGRNLTTSSRKALDIWRAGFNNSADSFMKDRLRATASLN